MDQANGDGRIDRIGILNRYRYLKYVSEPIDLTRNAIYIFVLYVRLRQYSGFSDHHLC